MEEIFSYAILSYKRENKQPTLDFLSELGVPKEKIHLFVQTKEDFRKYQKYNKRATIHLEPAKRGIEARNNILRCLDGYILMLDDDIKRISKLSSGQLVPFESREEFASVFNRCFKKTKKLGGNVFGIYPVHNAFFMQKSISTRVSINTVFGFLDGREYFDEQFDTKEDAEYCGRILNRGEIVVRYNFLAVEADHRKTKDGYIDDWHQEENLRSVKLLCDKYPNIFAPQTKKPWEVRVLIKDEKIMLSGAEEAKRSSPSKSGVGSGIKQDYQSPRWSGEVADCSMPMTFDTYSNCAYNCAYCFSQFQRSLSTNNPEDYFGKVCRSVNAEKVKKMFTFERDSQFSDYIKQRKTFQWGGLSDQFDEFERRHGVTLELLKFFKEQNYPICFSTKGTWWLDDERYTSLFEGQKNWNCKFSIITNDDADAKKVEIGVPSTTNRIEAIRKFTELDAGGATLRLRPFIIGMTSKGYLELIERAYEAGSRSVTTEFLCIENRACSIPHVKKNYDIISDVCGFDILEFYKKYSYGTGYMRLNRKIKEKYVRNMQDLCKKIGMRFYVSDAHFKEACDGSCCCGLSTDWNYSLGNFSYALQLCKKNGSVRFSEIEKEMSFLENVQYNSAEAFNTGSTSKRAKFTNMSMVDYMRYLWNNPNSGQSPCKMFEKVMYPDGYDKEGNIVYRYNKDVTYVR